jgi:hypothetical protein
MGDSKELIDYIEKVKKVINKVKQIELFFKEINNEEQKGGGDTKIKIEKYKKEILKLREKKNKYLMELEMYKEKIKELSFQNQLFNQKISQLSFANYVNSTEKNNLIDKLDFFNKSLDILQGSILTNVNAGNQLLEKFNTKTNINQENKVSNVSITVKAEDLYKQDGLEIKLDGGQNDQYLPIINQIETINNQLVPITNQQVGGEIGKFQRVNKITQISNELRNKISLMSTITQGVRTIIENIVRVVNDQGNQNSLLNIRIKFEWLINRFKELYEEHEEAKELLEVLEQVKNGLGDNISNIGVFENLLKKIETDTKGFVSGVEEISNNLPEKDIIDNAILTRAGDNNPNITQVGGSNINKLLYLIESGGTDINKLINFLQYGGVGGDYKKDTNYNEITEWIPFYANLKKWNDTFKYIFNNIRTNFYMILETLHIFNKTYERIPKEQNPYFNFCELLKDTIFILECRENNFSEFFKDDFIEASSTEKKKILNNQISEETELDFFKFMLGILVNNNKDTPDELNLKENLEKIININNNLNELLYSFMFINNLQYAFKLECIKPEMIIESQQLQEELKKLLYQTELYKNQSEYLKVKVELIRRIYQKLYWDPLEVFLKIYDNLEEKLQKDIDIIEKNFKLFILGMKYSSNQSQDHATFFKINLSKDTSIDGTIDYENTFKYIIMLKAALYSPLNEDFLSIIETGESDEKITKDIIVKYSGYSITDVPIIKVIALQRSANNLQFGGGENDNIKNPDLLEAFNYLIKEITPYIEILKITQENLEKILRLNSFTVMDITIFNDKIEECKSIVNTAILETQADPTPVTDKLVIYLNFLLQLFDFIKTDVTEKFDESLPSLKVIDQVDKDAIETQLSSQDVSVIEAGKCAIREKISSENDLFLKLLLEIYKQRFDEREVFTQTLYIPQEQEQVTTATPAPATAQSTGTQVSLQSSETDYLELSKTKIINGNRSKISDINDMLDKFIDGLKYDSFDKIKQNLITYTTEITNRRENGPFAKFTIADDIIKSKIQSINNDKTLRIQKAFIKLILENIDEFHRDKLLENYIKIIGEELTSKITEMTTLVSTIATLNQDKVDLKSEIMILNSQIKMARTMPIKNENIAKREPKIKDFITKLNRIKLESRKNIKFLNTKALLLNFIEFMKNQKELYADNAVEDKLKEDIIKRLENLPSLTVPPTGTLEQFNEGKKDLKENIRELINTGEGDPNFIKKFNIIKKLNTQLIYTVDKIISESLNAITVFVKARKEGDTESERYSYDKTCVTVTDKKGTKNKFGQFKNIFWSNKTITDLYCGKDINCDEKVPLTNSVRDVIEKKSISNTIITYGASGSGKTTLLFGRGDSLIEGDRKGIITRIIEDILGGSEISESGEELEIECLIGEIYGEKMNLSLLDNRYIECLYIWNLNAETPTEKMYIHNFSNESTGTEYDNFNKKLKFLQEIKSSQYTSNERIFDISVLDKAKIWRSTHDMNNTFYNTELYKYLNLKGYTPTNKGNYDIKYNVVGSNDDDNRTLYNIITDSDSYRKWQSEGKIYNIKDITAFGKKLSEQLENIINKIQVLRRIKNRVRCTKYNPDSSRSHMFIVVRLVDKITGKFRYYNFIDKAGSEIPYEIAADEFVRLAEDPDDNNINFYTIKYNVDKYITENRGTPEKNKNYLSNMLKGVSLNDIQEFSKSTFANESTMRYSEIENPKIILSFSENYKIEITTRIENVSDIKVNEIEIPGQATRIDIGIKELELSFVIKIIDSGVSREFEPIKTKHDVTANQQLDIKLKYILDLLQQNSTQILTDKDKLLIKNIILNVKKCKIKKNMQQVLFSGKNSASTTDIQTEITNVNQKISTLTDNLMKIIEYLGSDPLPSTLGLSIPLDGILSTFESINQSKFDFDTSTNLLSLNTRTLIGDDYIFLAYNLNDLIALTNIAEINISLDDATKFTTTPSPQVFKINQCRCDNITTLNADIIVNIKLLNSYLHLLVPTEEGHKNKIINLKNDIVELNNNIQQGVNITPVSDTNFSAIITAIIKPEGYDYILNCIEQGILLMKRLYIFIDLNNKITKHKDDTNPIKTKAFDALLATLLTTTYPNINAGFTAINKYKTDYEKDFFKTLFEQVIEKSYTSTVDTTIPNTKTLGIDYKNILAAYYIQRGYFSNLKQGAIGCNSPAIIDASNLIVETIKFLFDNVNNNIIIKSMLDQKFQSDTDPSFTVLQSALSSEDSEIVTIDKNDIFALEPTLKEKITSWIESAEGNKPETLANLTPFLLALQYDVNHFKGIKQLLFKNYDPNHPTNPTTDDKLGNFTFYFVLEASNAIDKNVIIKSLTNLIKRLYLISKLNEIFRFLDLITYNKIGNEHGDKKILDIYSNTSLISYFDDILWSECDKITYMIEFEKIFNFKILFDLFKKKQENSIKYIELTKAKKIWIEGTGSNYGEKYGSLWESVANKIVPMYLLNVRQGFWINHSIRYLMRTIMYTSDDIWIEHTLFDAIPIVIANSKSALGPPPIGLGKNETVDLLVSNIQLLKDFITKFETSEDLTSKIFSNEETLENVYLAEYQIEKSPWLKLLGTLHHLGSNIHPTDIVIKKPESKSKTKTTNTTNTTNTTDTIEIKSNKDWKMLGDEFLRAFMKLNKNHIKGTNSNEQNTYGKDFVQALYNNPDLPNVFKFDEKTYTATISPYIGYLNPPTLETIKKLRLPFLNLLTVNEVEKIKGQFMGEPKFTNLFKFIIKTTNTVVEKTELDEINVLIDKHNLLFGNASTALDIEAIKNKIKAYQEAVVDFKKKVEENKFNDLPQLFADFNKTQEGGSKIFYQNNLFNQYGGVYTDTEKKVFDDLIPVEWTGNPNGTSFPRKKSPNYNDNSSPSYKLFDYLLKEIDIIDTVDYNNKKISDIINAITERKSTDEYQIGDTANALIKIKELYEKFNEKFSSLLIKLNSKIEKILTSGDLSSIKDDITYYDNVEGKLELYKKIDKDLIKKYFNIVETKDNIIGPNKPKSFGNSYITQLYKDSPPSYTPENKAIITNLIDNNKEKILKTIIELNIIKFNTELDIIKGDIQTDIINIFTNVNVNINDTTPIVTANAYQIIKIQTIISEIEEINKKYAIDIANIQKNNTPEQKNVVIDARLMIVSIYQHYIDVLSKIVIDTGVSIDKQNNQIEVIFNKIKDIVDTKIILEQITPIRSLSTNSDYREKITKAKADATSILIEITEKQRLFKTELADANALNSGKREALKEKLTNELIIKDKLNLNYQEIKKYHEDYNTKLQVLNASSQLNPQTKALFDIAPLISTQPINRVDYIDQDTNIVLNAVLNIIISDINDYITNKFPIFPNNSAERPEELEKFNELVKNIRDKIYPDIYPQLEEITINTLEKVNYNQRDGKVMDVNKLIEDFNTKVYDTEITSYADLANKLNEQKALLATNEENIKGRIKDIGLSNVNVLNNNSPFINVNILPNTQINYYTKVYTPKKPSVNPLITQINSDSNLNALVVEREKINTEIKKYNDKVKIYEKYFTLTATTNGEDIDNIIQRLYNVYYIGTFNQKPEISYNLVTDDRKNEVETIIKNILVSLNSTKIMERGTVLVDPLATLRSNNSSNTNIELPAVYTIEDLKLSKQVKSSEVSTSAVFSISSSRSLLLALSTRPDKVELVTNTLFFAMLLSKITNPSCEMEAEPEVKQKGGDIYKKYSIVKNYLSNNYERNSFNTSYNKKYKLLNTTMTGGKNSSKKIIFLDEKEEINDTTYKNYKIIKTNK